ncbi:MAG TPA: PASTA domain-containing protein [Candidatus Acidoferrales bacterium]|nr:PASTA domain-containing protein [Candidatus Acidoferrales bacterium]
MNLRDRMEWLLRMSLLVFILGAAAFLSAVTAIRFAIRGSEVELPSVVGKSASDAKALLASKQLEMRITDRVFSELPANAVMQQSPPAGEEMKTGQDVRVVLSLGPQTISVPSLSGESLHAAQIQMIQAGLQLGELSTCYLPGLPADQVVGQDPPAGNRAAAPRVDLLISAGDPPAAYVMPELVGLNEVDADRVLGSSALHPAQINYAPASQAPSGSVVQQVPAAGTRIEADVAVTLTVAQ